MNRFASIGETARYGIDGKELQRVAIFVCHQQVLVASGLKVIKRGVLPSQEMNWRLRKKPLGSSMP